MRKKIIRYDTVRNQVYQCIRQNIADGLYCPGDRLNEVQIAEELNVSRSPVREAIKQLTGDGFVVYVPNKGSFVKQLTLGDFNDMYDMRVMIESYAIEKACRLLQSETRRKLEKYYEEFPKLHTVSTFREYIELDKLFHTTIVENSGNPYAIEVFNNLFIQISLFRTISLSDNQRFQSSLRDHLKMIEHVMNGKSTEAVRMVNIHLTYGKETVSTSLQERMLLAGQS